MVATAGLVLTIAALTRSGRPHHIGWAVGAYITAAYWFTSSTSFANPAVTIARTLSDTFAGINPASVPAFLACQTVGGALGYLTARTLYPTHRRTSHDRATSHPSCSSASTTPAGPRWPPATSPTSPAAPSRSAPPAPNPPTGSTPSPSQAMAEEGIDIAAEQPKILTTDAVKASDVVITMGCGDTCPFYPASATRTGSSTTPPAKTSTTSDPSATRSASVSKPSSPTCCQHACRACSAENWLS